MRIHKKPRKDLNVPTFLISLKHNQHFLIGAQCWTMCTTLRHHVKRTRLEMLSLTDHQRSKVKFQTESRYPLGSGSDPTKSLKTAINCTLALCTGAFGYIQIRKAFGSVLVFELRHRFSSESVLPRTKKRQNRSLHEECCSVWHELQKLINSSRRGKTQLPLLQMSIDRVPDLSVGAQLDKC